MRSAVLAFVGAGAAAVISPVLAQTISHPAGCVAGVACQVASMAVGGATLGGSALAVTGSTSLGGAVTLNGFNMAGVGQLSLGGASVGSNVLAATGTASISGVATVGSLSSGGNVRATTDSGLVTIGSTNDVILSRRSAATLQLGDADNAAPVAQTISAQSVVAGNLNANAPTLTIAGTRGTGTGSGGAISFQVAPSGSSGSAQNSLITALSICPSVQRLALGFCNNGYPALQVSGTNVRAVLGDNSATTNYSGLGFIADSGGSHSWAGRATLTSPVDTTVRINNSALSASVDFSENGNNVFQHGAADAASPVAQTVQAQGVAAGTANTAGAPFTLAGSKGTGTGAGGSLVFQVAPAGTSGSAQNALATALTIDSTKTATFGGSVIAGGANALSVAGRSSLFSGADGTFQMTNNTATGFTALNFGPATASFPRLAVSGSNISLQLGDGSALTNLNVGTITGNVLRTTPTTVAGLSSCTSGVDGIRQSVTDATATTFAAAAIGGGSNHVPVYCDGSATPTWRIG